MKQTKKPQSSGKYYHVAILKREGELKNFKSNAVSTSQQDLYLERNSYFKLELVDINLWGVAHVYYFNKRIEQAILVLQVIYLWISVNTNPTDVDTVQVNWLIL